MAQMVPGGVAAGFMLYVATELIEDLGPSRLVGAESSNRIPPGVGRLVVAVALLYREDG
jgi:lipopolysaccharide export system permease protein